MDTTMHAPSTHRYALTLPLLLIGTIVHGNAAAGDAPSPSPAALIPVTNCNNGGAGSLRIAIAAANSGDTIDLRSLQCRRVVLTSGAIEIAQDDLTILGPTRAFLIDGDRASAVIEHSGSGTLRLRAMSIAYGHHAGSAVTGGCIDSRGNLRLEYVRVHDCIAEETAGMDGSGGGGIAGNDVAVYDSEVFFNTAWPADPRTSPRGGGILAEGLLTLVRSRVSENFAMSGGGGGFFAGGGLDMRYSEITANAAAGSAALAATGESLTVAHSLIADNESSGFGTTSLTGSSIQVINTTVSGNSAWQYSGMSLQGPDKSVVNSTIVLNTGCRGALMLGAPEGVDNTLVMESTIVARNRCGDGTGADIVSSPVGDPGEVIGSDNLVMASSVPLPPDTISANPRISPLADNGGRTRTHALWAGSPAVDMGNNNAGLAYDQRGPGFDRVNGGRADIGAFER